MKQEEETICGPLPHHHHSIHPLNSEVVPIPVALVEESADIAQHPERVCEHSLRAGRTAAVAAAAARQSAKEKVQLAKSQRGVARREGTAFV